MSVCAFVCVSVYLSLYVCLSLSRCARVSRECDLRMCGVGAFLIASRRLRFALIDSPWREGQVTENGSLNNSAIKSTARWRWCTQWPKMIPTGGHYVIVGQRLGIKNTSITSEAIIYTQFIVKWWWKYITEGWAPCNRDYIPAVIVRVVFVITFVTTTYFTYIAGVCDCAMWT